MTSRQRGLSSEEAATRLAEWGPNIIFKPRPIRFVDILWEEVREPMILLLLCVGVLYSVLGEPQDAVTIFAVILLMAFVEVQNEFRAKRAVQRPSEIASPILLWMPLVEVRKSVLRSRRAAGRNIITSDRSAG